MRREKLGSEVEVIDPNPEASLAGRRGEQVFVSGVNRHAFSAHTHRQSLVDARSVTMKSVVAALVALQYASSVNAASPPRGVGPECMLVPSKLSQEKATEHSLPLRDSRPY